MKLLIFLYHFAISLTLPCVALFLLFNFWTALCLFCLMVSAWFALYFNLDKIILFLLGAREIIDQDYQELFQQVKNASYQGFEAMPKIYLYSGNALKVFVLESRSEWAIVLERSLLATLGPEQVKALSQYFLRCRKSMQFWRITKSHGLASLVIAANYSFWTKVVRLDSDSKAFRLLSFLTLVLLKPYVEGVLLAARPAVRIETEQSLESLINQNNEMDPGLNYDQFLQANLRSNINPRELILGQLESYPALEEAVVRRSF